MMKTALGYVAVVARLLAVRVQAAAPPWHSAVGARSSSSGMASSSVPPRAREPLSPSIVGAGVIHDSLCCKYALQHLRALARADTTETTMCFFVGPEASDGLERLLAHALGRTLDPDPASKSDVAWSNFAFGSASVSGAPTAAGRDDVWLDFSGALSFRVASTTPHLPKVVRDAPRIADHSSLAVAKVDVLHYSLATQTMRVALVSKDGHGPSDLFLLSCSSLSVDDRWKVAPDIVHVRMRAPSVLLRGVSSGCARVVGCSHAGFRFRVLLAREW